MKVNLHSRTAPQAGCRDTESFFLQSSERHLGIQSAHRGPGLAINHDKNIGPAKELDLSLWPPRTQGVQLPSQIANREINVTCCRAIAEKLGGTAWKHGMAERGDAQPGNQECDPNAGAQNGAKNRRSRNQTGFSRLHIYLVVRRSHRSSGREWAREERAEGRGHEDFQHGRQKDIRQGPGNLQAA